MSIAGVPAYGTIEPRLIGILNETPQGVPGYPHLNLPPLQDPNIFKAPGRPPALEPDATTRVRQRSALPSQQGTAFERDVASGSAGTKPTEQTTSTTKPAKAQRALGVSSPQSLRKILDDPDDGDTLSSNKRQRIDTSKDDFVQLPQPVKKQKATKQAVPPIIIGLFEPPPNAAMFPPIASSSFHDSHGRNSLNTAPMLVSAGATGHDAINQRQPEPKGKQNESVNTAHRNSAKLRKRWTAEETNDLLRGVSKHGIGNWTRILQDSDFKFNGRRAVDLKDRFRTCCPDELLKGKGKAVADGESKNDGGRKSKKKSSAFFDDILVTSSDDSSGEDKTIPEPGKTPRKSKAHRKKLEDLAELGIKEPFKKSKRRERRLFTEAEDRNIILGFQKYGPLWTAIQKDPAFGLGDRRPTDLRDRLRNKDKEKNITDEEARKLSKVAPTGPLASTYSYQPANVISYEPPVTQEKMQLPSFPSYEGGPVLKATNSHSSGYPSFTELLGPVTAIEAPDPLSFSQPFEWPDAMASFGNEMDINRLLLDDTSWPPSSSSGMGKAKQSYTDIGSLLTTSHEAPNPMYNTAFEPQQILNQPSSSSKETSFNCG